MYLSMSTRDKIALKTLLDGLLFYMIEDRFTDRLMTSIDYYDENEREITNFHLEDQFDHDRLKKFCDSYELNNMKVIKFSPEHSKGNRVIVIYVENNKDKKKREQRKKLNKKQYEIEKETDKLMDGSLTFYIETVKKTTLIKYCLEHFVKMEKYKITQKRIDKFKKFFLTLN